MDPAQSEAVMEQDLDTLKYPIGKFVRGTKAETPARRVECIALIAVFPEQLRTEVQGSSDSFLDTPYRPGGWTVRQLVHHIADSHGQTLHRFKLALTEEKPTIKPYKEALWAEHIDARTMAVEPSLAIIAGTHARWVMLMRNMAEAEFERCFVHPEQQREISLAEALELYVWHSKHHLAHIIGLKQRMG
ncbi:MAG TPA: putative metal-dependent hydrolase [Flavobacteriales bacterium]|nr:putative metal-dependent hydrolase [Flavobacteriales bacterium]